MSSGALKDLRAERARRRRNEWAAKYAREDRAMRKELGLCIVAGCTELPVNEQHCERHRQLQRERVRRYQARVRDAKAQTQAKIDEIKRIMAKLQVEHPEVYRQLVAGEWVV